MNYNTINVEDNSIWWWNIYLTINCLRILEDNKNFYGSIPLWDCFHIQWVLACFECSYKKLLFFRLVYKMYLKEMGCPGKIFDIWKWAGKTFRILSMRRENFQKSEHAKWYFKLFEHNQLFIHHVECKLCFTTANKGKYKLNFELFREN